MNPLFIVAEVSKTWLKGDEDEEIVESVGTLFEGVINRNWERGYEMVSFRFSQVAIGAFEMTETIIAVFKRSEEPKP